MLAAQFQTPTFFFERAIDRLASKFPAEEMDRLRANLQAFRAWVAEPAFREQSPEDAVEHVLTAVGPAAQLKAEFLATVASVPGGLELFVQAVTEDLADLAPEEASPELTEAAELLQRAQRVWFRFIAFHRELAHEWRTTSGDQLGRVLTLGFHADNLLTICLMARDGLSSPPDPQVIQALCTAALDFARRYHEGIRSLVESVAPQVDFAAPFKTTTVSDLLALPPYDGPAATIEEMEEAIGALFGPP